MFKSKADGSIERYKARFVTKGYSQIKGVDYVETYSPVVRYSMDTPCTVHYLMAIAMRLGLKIHQLDAVTAFLQGDLTDEEIYVEQPEGFAIPDNQVCRLKKTIYGYKQASRVWNKKLNNVLKEIGLQQSKMDSCVYFLIDGDKILIVAVYVDDMFVFTNDDEIVDALKQ